MPHTAFFKSLFLLFFDFVLFDVSDFVAIVAPAFLVGVLLFRLGDELLLFLIHFCHCATF